MNESMHIDKMPLLFVGHGNPMYAIEENEFTIGFKTIVKHIPIPDSIVCISAHWESSGSMVTCMDNPRTIHDFRGFPSELYEVNYPAPGSVKLAEEIIEAVKPDKVKGDLQWGLDHGTWSVLKHLYPKADIPVIQISLDKDKTLVQHYKLAETLKSFRLKNILFIGSGNIVHNLRLIDWHHLYNIGHGYDWAIEVQSLFNQMILNYDIEGILMYLHSGKYSKFAFPSFEHILPLVYIMGLQEKGENVSIFNDKAIAGSLTMTSFLSKQQI